MVVVGRAPSTARPWGSWGGGFCRTWTATLSAWPRAQASHTLCASSTPGIAESVAVDENAGDTLAIAPDQTKGYIASENSRLAPVGAGSEEGFAGYRLSGRRI